MNQDQFMAKRQARWVELSRILAEARQQGPRQLPLETVQRLGRLYRGAASDLAYARTYYPDSDLVAYLNQLVARAHTFIYAEEPHRLRAVLRFFGHTVPAMICRHWQPILLAALLFGTGLLVGCIGVLYDPNLAEALVPEAVLEHIVTPEERYYAAVEERAVVGTLIMLNNVRVGVFAFGLGITLGIGTAIVLFYNGVIVGAVAGQSVSAGHWLSLWAHLLAHGTLELMAIFLCGAAGFVMGWSILAPGELPRRVSATRGARQALTLVMGALPLFVVAAIIEGWITPVPELSPGFKFLVGVATGAVAVAYALLAGRKPLKGAPAP
jgi:uncharacterized membrane protein SpoIIM required for sporulation